MEKCQEFFSISDDAVRSTQISRSTNSNTCEDRSMSNSRPLNSLQETSSHNMEESKCNQCGSVNSRLCSCGANMDDVEMDSENLVPDVCCNEFGLPNTGQFVDNSFPWMTEFQKMCNEVIFMPSIKGLEELMTFYTEHISVDVRYVKPNRATKLKRNLNDVLVFFYICYKDLKSVENSLYLRKMANLLSFYIDMEIKASRRGKESVKKISSKLITSLYLFLDKSVDHILDSILGAKFIIKPFREICIPVLRRVLDDIPPPTTNIFMVTTSGLTNTMTYVRYLLTFRLWKRIVRGTDQRRRINALAIKRLQQAPDNIRDCIKTGILNGVLPNIPKSKKDTDITQFLIQAKFDVKVKSKEFFKIMENSSQFDTDRCAFFGEDLESAGIENNCNSSNNNIIDITSPAKYNEPNTSRSFSTDQNKFNYENLTNMSTLEPDETLLTPFGPPSIVSLIDEIWHTYKTHRNRYSSGRLKKNNNKKINNNKIMKNSQRNAAKRKAGNNDFVNIKPNLPMSKNKINRSLNTNRVPIRKNKFVSKGQLKELPEMNVDPQNNMNNRSCVGTSDEEDDDGNDNIRSKKRNSVEPVEETVTNKESEKCCSRNDGVLQQQDNAMDTTNVTVAVNERISNINVTITTTTPSAYKDIATNSSTINRIAVPTNVTTSFNSKDNELVNRNVLSNKEPVVNNNTENIDCNSEVVKVKEEPTEPMEEIVDPIVSTGNLPAVSTNENQVVTNNAVIENTENVLPSAVKQEPESTIQPMFLAQNRSQPTLIFNDRSISNICNDTIEAVSLTDVEEELLSKKMDAVLSLNKDNVSNNISNQNLINRNIKSCFTRDRVLKSKSFIVPVQTSVKSHVIQPSGSSAMNKTQKNITQQTSCSSVSNQSSYINDANVKSILLTPKNNCFIIDKNSIPEFNSLLSNSSFNLKNSSSKVFVTLKKPVTMTTITNLNKDIPFMQSDINKQFSQLAGTSNSSNSNATVNLQPNLFNMNISALTKPFSSFLNSSNTADPNKTVGVTNFHEPKDDKVLDGSNNPCAGISDELQDAAVLPISNRFSPVIGVNLPIQHQNQQLPENPDDLKTCVSKEFVDNEKENIANSVSDISGSIQNKILPLGCETQLSPSIVGRQSDCNDVSERLTSNINLDNLPPSSINLPIENNSSVSNLPVVHLNVPMSKSDVNKLTDDENEPDNILQTHAANDSVENISSYLCVCDDHSSRSDCAVKIKGNNQNDFKAEKIGKANCSAGNKYFARLDPYTLQLHKKNSNDDDRCEQKKFSAQCLVDNEVNQLSRINKSSDTAVINCERNLSEGNLVIDEDFLDEKDDSEDEQTDSMSELVMDISAVAQEIEVVSEPKDDLTVFNNEESPNSEDTSKPITNLKDEAIFKRIEKEATVNSKLEIVRTVSAVANSENEKKVPSIKIKIIQNTSKKESDNENSTGNAGNFEFVCESSKSKRSKSKRKHKDREHHSSKHRSRTTSRDDSERDDHMIKELPVPKSDTSQVSANDLVPGDDDASNTVTQALALPNECNENNTIAVVSDDVNVVLSEADRLHQRTCEMDRMYCQSQFKFRDFYYRYTYEPCPSIPVPYPPSGQDNETSDGKPSRCPCSQCEENRSILVANYKKLNQYRNDRIKDDVEFRKHQDEQLIRQIEKSFYYQDVVKNKDRRLDMSRQTAVDMVDIEYRRLHQDEELRRIENSVMYQDQTIRSVAYDKPIRNPGEFENRKRKSEDDLVRHIDKSYLYEDSENDDSRSDIPRWGTPNTTQDCSLPLKKRKTLTHLATDNFCDIPNAVSQNDENSMTKSAPSHQDDHKNESRKHHRRHRHRHHHRDSGKHGNNKNYPSVSSNNTVADNSTNYEFVEGSCSSNSSSDVLYNEPHRRDEYLSSHHHSIPYFAEGTAHPSRMHSGKHDLGCSTSTSITNDASMAAATLLHFAYSVKQQKLNASNAHVMSPSSHAYTTTSGSSEDDRHVLYKNENVSNSSCSSHSDRRKHRTDHVDPRLKRTKRKSTPR